MGAKILLPIFTQMFSLLSFIIQRHFNALIHEDLNRDFCRHLCQFARKSKPVRGGSFPNNRHRDRHVCY
ncbi:hypothetical protein B9Z55_027304 [Caenorhabditis nigoni]|uniref:Uncharacterized protein n=1 Tax=Caenorhabditis nigoni TaxID=1611254 RepID=A0A2G5SFY0_9PELO|nr:hypothetical protein B9Z55_027304 [Caenorhabditis nigoni]